MIEAKESSKARGSLKPEDSSYNMIMYYLLGYQLNVHERTADPARCHGVGGLELSSSARFFGLTRYCNTAWTVWRDPPWPIRFI